MRGKKFGAPKAKSEDLKFDNFDSVLLDFKTTNIMKGVLGRTKRTSALMVTGRYQLTSRSSLILIKTVLVIKCFSSH